MSLKLDVFDRHVPNRRRHTTDFHIFHVKLRISHVGDVELDHGSGSASGQGDWLPAELLSLLLVPGSGWICAC